MKAVLRSVSCAKKGRDCFYELRRDHLIGTVFMFQGREWSAPGGRDIDGFAGTGNLRSERARASQYFSELGIYDYRHRFYHPLLGRFLQGDPMGLQTEGAKLTPEQKALYGAGASEAFASSEMNLFRYCGDDPVDRSDPTGLDAVQNKDGTYHFTVRSDLVLRNLAGTHVTNSNPRFTEQCATGGQFLTGTVVRGTVHDAPATRTWVQGETVGHNTAPGTMIARGWENGTYPNRVAGNHVGIYLGLTADGKAIRIFDQFAGAHGELRERRVSVREGWSTVVSQQEYDPRRSDSAVRAFEYQRRPIGGGRP